MSVEHCRTGKKVFRDELAAKMEIARLIAHSPRDKTPQRAYRCTEFCQKWHMTSQEKRRKR